MPVGQCANSIKHVEKNENNNDRMADICRTQNAYGQVAEHTKHNRCILYGGAEEGGTRAYAAISANIRRLGTEVLEIDGENKRRSITCGGGHTHTQYDDNVDNNATTAAAAAIRQII
jgi:hypothetical protein